MFKPSWIMVALLASQTSLAFNPFKALSATAGKKVMGFFNEGGLEDFIDAGDALAELMDEAEVDDNLIQEVEQNVKRLENLNRDAKKIEAIGKDVKDFLNFDLLRSKSIAGKLKSFTQKIRHGRRLYSLLSRSKTKSSASNPLQVEQVRISYRILDELRNIRLNEFNRYLEDRENKVRLKIALEQTLNEERNYQKSRWKSLRSKRGSL